MEALFLKLVNMSITATWLVLAIIAVRLVFRKMPKWIICLLWGLVAFRLLCPFSIESALSLIPNSEPLPQDIIYTAHPQLQSGIIIIDNTVNPMLESNMTPIEPVSANPMQVWSFILSKVWVLGVVLMLLYTVLSYLLLKQKVATSIPLGKGIKQSEFIDSPFVLGLIRPVIYLPFGMEEADMAYVIAHEKAHIRRRDHWWKPFGFLLLSIYWFNPVLWVAYILLCRDIEAACDEKVIKDMIMDDRRAYSTALLNCSVHRRRIAACPLAFGETGVKARVKGIMNYRQPAFWVLLIASIVSIIVAVCFLTNPKKDGSWVRTNYGQTYVELECNLEIPIQSYAFYEDIYENGELISSEVIVRDTFQEEGGATQRQTTFRLDVQPVYDEKGGFSGELSVQFGGVGSAQLTRKLPKDHYTGMVHKTAEIGSGIFRKQNVDVEDNITLLTILLSTDPDGKVTVQTKNNSLVQENDTVVIYRFATSEESNIGLANVYPWFDENYNSGFTYTRKTGTITIPGTEAKLLFRDQFTDNLDEDQLLVETDDGYNPVITGTEIRNVYLTDLTGDGIAEVCATVWVYHPIYNFHIAVYDYSENRVYTLESPGELQYELTCRNDTLIATMQKENLGSILQMGTLALIPDNSAEGYSLQIISLDDSFRKLTETITCIDVYTKKVVCLSSQEEIESMVTLLHDLQGMVVPVSATEMEPILADDFNWNILLINYGLGARQLRFSADYQYFWEDGMEGGYRIQEPDALRTFVENVTDGVRNRQTSGDPFATMDAPWDWCSRLNADAISTANMDVHLYKIGNKSSSAGGVLSCSTLEELVSVLNQIPQSAFRYERTGSQFDYWDFSGAVGQTGVCVSLTDTINQMLVAVRTNGSRLELLTTNDLEKMQDEYRHEYFDAVKMWTIESPELSELLQTYFEDPPVITYTVGSEYNWQPSVKFTAGDFKLTLWLVEGWEYEEYSDRKSSGIRIRPADVEEGWIYFSFWPNDYKPVEEDRYFFDGYYNDRLHRVSYPSNVSNEIGIDTRNAIWSYQYDDLVEGDYVIINDGADSWFLKYKDQISDIITISIFSVE